MTMPTQRTVCKSNAKTTWQTSVKKFEVSSFSRSGDILVT